MAANDRAQQLILLVEQVRDYAIFMLDADGHVATWNRGAERINGYRAEEIIGRHFSTFYTPDAIERDHPAYELRVAIKEGRFEEEGWRVRKDGSRFWSNVVITTIYDREGRHIGFGKVTRDLSERRALQEDLERSNEDLRRFASLAAHDLAEPLRTIGGFADLINRRYGDQLPAEAQPFFQQIVNGVGRMDALIGSLLGYARAGDVAPGNGLVAIAPVVSGVLADLAAAIEESEARISVEVPADAHVHAGEYGLALVLQNLVSNALKFGGEEQPRIEIGAAPIDGAWRVSVRDHGAGIDPDEAQVIFQPFRRGRLASAPGNGLGLTTCKRIVERHRGTIGVTSQPGDGSEFWFTLPSG